MPQSLLEEHDSPEQLYRSNAKLPSSDMLPLQQPHRAPAIGRKGYAKPIDFDGCLFNAETDAAAVFDNNNFLAHHQQQQ